MQITNPYLRLIRAHQPAGTWLLLWPCWWSLALAGQKEPVVYVLFMLGAFAMRSAGCVINDMFDRKFDRQVARTISRPLASGELSMGQAMMVLVALLIAGLMVAISLGEIVVWWALAAMPLVFVYPLMKRITWWPQLFLGITFNWGALLGWVSVHGSIADPALLLYLACIFWTLGYDTIYAHQDKADDSNIGVKSSALKLEEKTKLFVSICYGIFMLLLAILMQPVAWFEVVCLLAAALHLGWQLWRVELNQPASCLKIFKSNIWFGWAVLAGFIYKLL